MAKSNRDFLRRRRNGKAVLGIKELSQYLDISKNTAYYWVRIRKIPYVKMGRLVKFDLRKLKQWLKERRVKVID